jgi:hypothetical protein
VTAEDDEGVWNVSAGTGEVPVLSRWRSDVTVADPRWPVKITIGVMFNARLENGMPDLAVEGDFLEAVEQDVIVSLAKRDAELVLVVTGDGNREWIAYASSHDWLAEWAPAFDERWFGGHTCRIAAENDPTWSTYQTFTGQKPAKRSVSRRLLRKRTRP